MTLGARCCSASIGTRSAGAEMPTAAITFPVRVQIGAATPRTRAVHSPSIEGVAGLSDLGQLRLQVVGRLDRLVGELLEFCADLLTEVIGTSKDAVEKSAVV